MSSRDCPRNEERDLAYSTPLVEDVVFRMSPGCECTTTKVEAMVRVQYPREVTAGQEARSGFNALDVLPRLRRLVRDGYLTMAVVGGRGKAHQFRRTERTAPPKHPNCPCIPKDDKQ